MTIINDISLKPYNSFGIDVSAKYFIAVQNEDELEAVLSSPEYPDKIVLGGGSNMLLTKDVEALVVHVNMKGIEIISQDDDSVIIKVNAGENWHDFVRYCLDNDFGGIENLSLIPGNVGTAPIQNIGAYGVELKDVFVSCQAVEIATQKVRQFSKDECRFNYRNSIFKQEEKGNFIITSVTFKLSKRNHRINTDYGAIREELRKMKVENASIQDVSRAVVAIRQSKLPDPKTIGNGGSFFKNPVISMSLYEELKGIFPKIPNYPVSKNEVKVPAGWLIETAGFKGKCFGAYGVHDKQALVLVNYGGANGLDIFELSKLIQFTIKRIFKIKLEAEVNII